MTDSKLDALRKVPLFTGCDGRAMAAINQLADEVDLRDGAVLAREGDLGHEFFLILQGTVRIEREGKTLDTLGPGDFLGEIALLQEGRRTATATAEGPVRVAVLTHQGFDSLLDTQPGITRAVLQALATRLRGLQPEAVD
ncbi:MAG TPA: cyclic nucleotide-binding domain-containing protein [Candidatus Limnocylindrales bacterium]|jgi:CRP-like cAMP-binding protein|nr:cyclic nucleotide-binding domain-containing protein [Candidatus Limnocylindrales bacterium]